MTIDVKSVTTMSNLGLHSVVLSDWLSTFAKPSGICSCVSDYVHYAMDSGNYKDGRRLVSDVLCLQAWPKSPLIHAVFTLKATVCI